MREIRDREFPAAGGEQVYHFLQSTEKQTENERKYYEKSWKKASAIFMAAALAAGLAGCGASNNNNTATTAAGKSAAESKVNGENSPEADNKKTDVTVILDYVANT